MTAIPLAARVVAVADAFDALEIDLHRRVHVRARRGVARRERAAADDALANFGQPAAVTPAYVRWIAVALMQASGIESEIEGAVLSDHGHDRTGGQRHAHVVEQRVQAAVDEIAAARDARLELCLSSAGASPPALSAREG